VKRSSKYFWSLIPLLPEYVLGEEGDVGMSSDIDVHIYLRVKEAFHDPLGH